MNDEDIKKALEYCFNGECEFCPYRGDKFFCFDKVKEEALDLINRQQAENEKLKWEKDHFEFKVDDLNGKLEKFKEYRDIKNGAYEREIEKLQAVIDDLKHEIRNLECEKGQLEGTIDFLVEQAKSEAIKEFAERLKESIIQENDLYVKCAKNLLSTDYQQGYEEKNNKIVKCIDNLLTEKVGEQNA